MKICKCGTYNSNSLFKCMDCGETLPIEDELEVETYSQHELKSKKRNIVARVAIAGVVVVAAIGIAGLAINFHLNKSGNDKNVVQTWDYRNYNVMGGSGSWFLSRMERFDG